MKLAFDVARCTGKAAPFGRHLDAECHTCARASQTEHGPNQMWLKPIQLPPGKCGHRIENKEKHHD